jgi:hypothetical protein
MRESTSSGLRSANVGPIICGFSRPPRVPLEPREAFVVAFDRLRDLAGVSPDGAFVIAAVGPTGRVLELLLIADRICAHRRAPLAVWHHPPGVGRVPPASRRARAFRRAAPDRSRLGPQHPPAICHGRRSGKLRCGGRRARASGSRGVRPVDRACRGCRCLAERGCRRVGRACRSSVHRSQGLDLRRARAVGCFYRSASCTES